MPDNNDKPPLFGSWSMWYLLVLVVLLALIGLFYYLTETFS